MSEEQQLFYRPHRDASPPTAIPGVPGATREVDNTGQIIVTRGGYRATCWDTSNWTAHAYWGAQWRALSGGHVTGSSALEHAVAVMKSVVELGIPEPPGPDAADRKTNIYNCARCGGDHLDIPMRLFKRAPPVWTQFAICPVTDEPILIQGVCGSVIDRVADPISDVVRDTVAIARDPASTVEGDASLCLPSWLKTFSNAYDANKAVELSANASAALYHTLLVAKARTERLVKERDAALGRLEDLRQDALERGERAD